MVKGFNGISAQHLYSEATLSANTLLSIHTQVTAFGAFLDIAVDNLTRAVIWSRAFTGLVGVLIPTLERLTFVCTHKVWPLYSDDTRRDIIIKAPHFVYQS